MHLPNPSATKWHKINFKQRKYGFNEKFSVSLTDCLTKAKKPNLPLQFIQAKWIRRNLKQLEYGKT